MDHEDSNSPELVTWFDGVVAEYSEPDRLAMRLTAVKMAAARRRVARHIVTSPTGGPLFRHACIEIARYFRGADRGELTLRDVSAQTGIALNDARAVLRMFVEAGILLERVEPSTGRDAPPTRYYHLADGGGTLAGEVVVQAETSESERFAVRAERLGWQW